MSLSESWQFLGAVDSVWYRAYDALRRGVNARLVDFLSESLPSVSPITEEHAIGGRVLTLEAGSGTAYASSLLAKNPDVTRAVCLDLDLAALQEGKKRDPTLTAVVGDLMNMPFASGTFALVFNNSTVEHLCDPVGAVREMHRVCHRHGRIFVGVPNAHGPLCFQPVLRDSRLGQWLGTVFTRAALERVFRSAGLNPVRYLRYFLHFFVGAVAVKNDAPPARGAGKAALC